ncbi:unnamed protein product [Triticum turgidum subsp. durum]|uniref:Uncharacterized protein n=1 Tax=Triticum turgidum subsp. durum TaxID=4567 RepID=A0A9R0VWG3_TRITD|nr:unnamed protein product [Triticum turgidum subsp. durum]
MAGLSELARGYAGCPLGSGSRQHPEVDARPLEVRRLSGGGSTRGDPLVAGQDGTAQTRRGWLRSGHSGATWRRSVEAAAAAEAAMAASGRATKTAGRRWPTCG